MNVRQRGMTLMEVLFSVAGVAILIFATISANSTALLSTRNNQDKQFATQKALSMLEELKSQVQVNTGTNITILDKYDDGSAYFPRLTIIGDKTGATTTQPADEPISGNKSMGTSWLYVRQISVKPLTDPTNASIIISSSDVRLVRVRVYRNDPAGPRLLAEVASVVRTQAVNFPTTQVYDIYCIAIENVPGWWVNMSSLISFVQNAINDLQNRQPGLQFNTHMIKHLGYGRDTQYIPYVNADITTNTQGTLNPIPYVYFYPGALPASYTPEAGGALVTPPAQYYYPPANFDATIRTEAGVLHGYNSVATATTALPANPFPYALADQYNHVMRYPDELALYNQRNTAVDGLGNLVYPKEEMTLRLLLDDMVMNPGNYTNAIVINLHGELLPFPPLRNYSDAAKKPDYYHGAALLPNGIRVVTHPQQLTYDGNNADDVDLRVYSYVTNPTMTGAAPGALANPVYRYPAGVQTPLISDSPVLPAREFLPEPITITLKGVNWVPGATDVKAITGGVNLDGVGGDRDGPYTTVSAPTSDALVLPAHRMYYSSSYIAPVAPATVGDTVIKLYNSPLVSPCLINSCATGGLAGYRQLYGQEYIPASLEDFSTGPAVAAFQAANNLDVTSDKTKNTARWLLHIPAATFTAAQNNSMFRVETRIGDWDQTATPPAFVGTISSGYATAANPKPADFEATYFWRGTPAWLYGAAGTNPALPPSERYQIQGDPRHMPYADLKKTHTTNVNTMTANTNLGRGYNPYFDDFEAGGTAAPNTPWSYPAEGNREGAEVVGTTAGPYSVTTSNNNLSLNVNGTTYVYAIPTGANQPASTIITALNAAGTFAGIATADVVCISPPCTNTTGRIRLTADTAGNARTIQLNAPANNPNTLLGFDTVSHTGSAWDGYNYTIGGVNYGIKNDGPVAGNPGTTQQHMDNDGWTTDNGSIEFDIPRAYQILRTALMTTNALFTTMSGWPYYYIGLGGEIGYDAASGFPTNVPMNKRPFDGTNTAQYFENTITPGETWGDGILTGAPLYGQAGSNQGLARSGVKYIQESDGSWWGMPWLGELYPDEMYANPPAGSVAWGVSGNLSTALPAASAANGFFRRVRREDVKGNDPADRTHTIGTVFTHSSRRTMGQGMPTFFWTGSANGVEADAGANTGALAAAGTEINTNYNFPLDNPILASRPFQLAAALPATDGLGLAIYGPSNAVTNQASFYTSVEESSELASALITVRQGATNLATYVVENGLSPTGQAGTDFIARWSFLSLIQGYFAAGLFNGSAAPATAQVPRVIITTPNPNTDLTDPSTITISWSTVYTRWDGRPYTLAYASTYNPAYAMSYWVTYSADNGATWKYIQDGTVAQPGVRLPPASYLTDTHRITASTVSWSTPSSQFPAGAYTIRVDGYRDNYQLHYAYHQYQAFINRTF
jgi:Tfp pilus assembly protein PilE